MKNVTLSLVLICFIGVVVGCSPKQQKQHSMSKPMDHCMQAGPMMNEPMAAKALDAWSSTTRLEIDAVRQLPPDKRMAVLQMLTQRPVVRPADKKYLLDAINELPDVDQRTNLLMCLIRKENKFVAEEMEFIEEMHECRICGGMGFRPEMQKHGEHEGMCEHEKGCCGKGEMKHEHGEKGEHEGMHEHEKGCGGKGEMKKEHGEERDED